MGQKRESTNSPPHIYGQLIYNKEAKDIQLGKDSLLNKWYWEHWTATCRRINLDPYLTRSTKINSKWIKDLNVRPETIKLPEGNIGSKFLDKGIDTELLDLTLKANTTKVK